MFNPRNLGVFFVPLCDPSAETTCIPSPLPILLPMLLASLPRMYRPRVAGAARAECNDVQLKKLHKRLLGCREARSSNSTIRVWPTCGRRARVKVYCVSSRIALETYPDTLCHICLRQPFGRSTAHRFSHICGLRRIEFVRGTLGCSDACLYFPCSELLPLSFRLTALCASSAPGQRANSMGYRRRGPRLKMQQAISARVREFLERVTKCEPSSTRSSARISAVVSCRFACSIPIPIPRAGIGPASHHQPKLHLTHPRSVSIPKPVSTFESPCPRPWPRAAKREVSCL